jgi:hypothetical protein
MSTVAGVYSETLIQDLWLKAQEVSMDDRVKLQFIPKIDTLNVLKTVQTARPMERGPADKEFDAILWWDNFCEIEAADCTSCEFPTTETSTNTERYTISWEKCAGFKLQESNFDNNFADFQDHFAKASLKAEVVLLEAFAQYAIAQLNTFKGQNVVTVGKGTVVGTDTYISPGFWDASLVAYFNRVTTLNQLTNPIFLSGNNLYEAWYDAKFKALDRTDPNRFNDMRLYFDLFNIDSVNTPNYITYLISQGSVALLNRALNPTTIESDETGQRWRHNSILFPGFQFDVFKKNECCSGEGDRKCVSVKFKLRGDVVLNPVGCSETNTGVLSFICGDAAPQ